MPALTITKTYDDGTAFTESQLDAFKNSIETFVNTTKLDSDNIQSLGIATANLADSAVTAAKIASDAVTTAKILDANVTTAKLADSSVTQGKLAALGQQISSSCGSYSNATTSYTDVTNLSVTITTNGQPVYLSLITIEGTGSSLNPDSTAYLKLVRDSTDISEYIIGFTGTSGYYAVGGINYVDVVAAGTYTYKLQAKKAVGTTAISVTNCRLIAFEL